MSTKLELKKDKEILKQIKRVIMDVAKEMGIEIDRIILFGSRARGDYREDSDWDILVVTKNEFQKNNLKWKFWDEVMKQLDYIDLELFIVDRKHFLRNARVVGNIEYISNKKGVVI